MKELANNTVDYCFSLPRIFVDLKGLASVFRTQKREKIMSTGIKRTVRCRKLVPELTSVAALKMAKTIKKVIEKIARSSRMSRNRVLESTLRPINMKNTSHSNESNNPKYENPPEVPGIGPIMKFIKL